MKGLIKIIWQDCFVLGKWKKELKYEFIDASKFTKDSKYWLE